MVEKIINEVDFKILDGVKKFFFSILLKIDWIESFTPGGLASNGGLVLAHEGISSVALGLFCAL